MFISFSIIDEYGDSVGSCVIVLCVWDVIADYANYTPVAVDETFDRTSDIL